MLGGVPAFDRGRVKPSLSVDASVGANVWKQDEKNATLQFDGATLTERIFLPDGKRIYESQIA